MDFKFFLTVFLTVFLAEIGDKTQLATMLYASKGESSPYVVFFAASSALVVAAGVGVLAGAFFSRVLDPAVLRWVAGAGFILVGIWTLYRG